jgi:hypothetical protein
VVLGLGSIATATGLAPARVFQDQTAYTTILRSALVAGVPSDIGTGRGHLLAPLLGEAILFHGITARAWFSTPLPLEVTAADPPAAIGAWLLMLTDLSLLIALLFRPTRRLVRYAQAQSRIASVRAEPEASAEGHTTA